MNILRREGHEIYGMQVNKVFKFPGLMQTSYINDRGSFFLSSQQVWNTL